MINNLEKPVVRVLGSSGSGKTTFINSVISWMKNWKIATIKHTRQKLDFFYNNKDTGRHIDSGAVATIGIGKESTEIFIKDSALLLEEAIEFLSARCDLIIVEGAREYDYPTLLLGDEPANSKNKNLLLKYPQRPDLKEEDYLEIEETLKSLIKSSC